MANTALQIYMNANPNKGPVESAVEVLLGAMSGSSTGSQLPYSADNYAVSYYGSTNNVHVITYKQGSTTVKTRTFTYAGGGAADNDKVTAVADS